MTATLRAKEPPFNAPGPVLALVASILIAYALQSFVFGAEPTVAALGLVPADVARGRVWELFSVLIVHGSWAHAGLNTLGVLAFGTPVARWFGRGGWIRFLAFYLVCAFASSGGYVLLHWDSAAPLVGASGAISGLMGASSRLLDGRGRLASFASRTVIAMGLAWLAINLLMAMRWIDVGAGHAPIAWEAHLIGYAAGLLLIAPFSTGIAGQPPLSPAS